MTTSTVYSVSVQTREGGRAPILVAARLLDAPPAEIGLDPAAAARLAADLCNAVYQSVYVAAGAQDSDDASPVCNGYWGALEAAKTLEDKSSSNHRAVSLPDLPPLIGRFVMVACDDPRTDEEIREELRATEVDAYGNFTIPDDQL